ncbi:sensor histidine kinase [Kineosporia sp. J2-2]|uniref:Sensor histidine kinase n=1 Tax=Kineosporia corallincola TaxID=2835133 RepID=A0ABS5TID1_9ACTN|nr:sensor histidine kinase [Kineosporia corallincola]MBT0770851.1 sensor histidine kinase [Kineosporia corallincola]
MTRSASEALFRFAEWVRAGMVPGPDAHRFPASATVGAMGGDASRGTSDLVGPPVLSRGPLGGRRRRELRLGPLILSPRLVLAGIWLVFLQDTLSAALRLESVLSRIAGTVVLVVFCVFYLYAFTVARSRTWTGRPLGTARFLSVCLPALGLTLLACWIIGEYGLTLLVYDGVVAVMIMRIEWAIGTVLALVAVVELSTRSMPGWVRQDGLALSILLSAVAVWGMTQMAARNIQLDLANDEIARLAVARERDRFARDLHDLLGHSLTVITMKSELAGRLVPLDPARAEAEIAEVERLARDALADVRLAVAGYREVTLSTELVSARTALDAAGIEAELPSAVDEVPGERRELFGWAVREGVTNVMRHSGARHCRITLTRDGIHIVDDGSGPPSAGSGNAGGHGLRGLRERAEAAGAVVTVGAGDDGRGFRLEVAFGREGFRTTGSRNGND